MNRLKYLIVPDQQKEFDKKLSDTIKKFSSERNLFFTNLYNSSINWNSNTNLNDYNTKNLIANDNYAKDKSQNKSFFRGTLLKRCKSTKDVSLTRSQSTAAENSCDIPPSRKRFTENLENPNNILQARQSFNLDDSDRKYLFAENRKNIVKELRKNFENQNSNQPQPTPKRSKIPVKSKCREISQLNDATVPCSNNDKEENLNDNHQVEKENKAANGFLECCDLKSDLQRKDKVNITSINNKSLIVENDPIYSNILELSKNNGKAHEGKRSNSVINLANTPANQTIDSFDTEKRYSLKDRTINVVTRPPPKRLISRHSFYLHRNQSDEYEVVDNYEEIGRVKYKARQLIEMFSRKDRSGSTRSNILSAVITNDNNGKMDESFNNSKISLNEKPHNLDEIYITRNNLLKTTTNHQQQLKRRSLNAAIIRDNNLYRNILSDSFEDSKYGMKKSGSVNKIDLEILKCELDDYVDPLWKANKNLGLGFRSHRYLNKKFKDMEDHVPTFLENFHMLPETFNTLFELLEPKLDFIVESRPTESITPKEKLACALEYLASGTLQRHIASIYRISKQYLGEILDKVCEAVCEVLKDEVPNFSMEKFILTSNDFNFIWNCPNTLGAIDGKHIHIKKPKNSGSLFFNYKGFPSIVLMGISDARYRFSYIDVGAFGTEGDANIFSKSKFGIDLLNEALPFPPNSSLGNVELPFYFIGDDAFPLHKRMIKPYKPSKNKKLTKEETIYNYRISRARRCIENAFGILSKRWMCLSRMMLCGPERAQKIATTCCYLHNYLMRNSKNTYCPINFADLITADGKLIEGEWRQNLNNSFTNSNIMSFQGRPYDSGKYNQEYLKQYFNSNEGKVAWQNNVY